MDIMTIKWEGPFYVKDLPALNNSEIDYGVYQIYGKHPVYGEDVLLYIGQANEQTFYTRLMQHAYWFESNFSFYIGRLTGKHIPSYETWHSEINRVEQLLIHIHAPAYNTANINSVNLERIGQLHIMNLGNYRSLLPELSSSRWFNEVEMLAEDVYKYKDGP